jgi:hypothetical protein
MADLSAGRGLEPNPDRTISMRMKHGVIMSVHANFKIRIATDLRERVQCMPQNKNYLSDKRQINIRLS